MAVSEEKNKEETAIAAYWATDGIDRCRVGFLPRHCVPHWQDFYGVLVQVVELLSNAESPTQSRRSYRNKGVCVGAIITTGSNK